MRNGLVSALCLWVAALVSLPANADIAAFNKAVKANDYKTAAAEAASTWPQLDKARDDISLIAREFGFAAYLAGDFSAARTYAQFAAEHTPEGTDRELAMAVSNVLVRAADYRIKANPENRKLLLDALNARAKQPGFDNVSVLGVDVLVSGDMEAGKWEDAQTSASLGISLTAKGGGYFLLARRRLELFSAVAEYMDRRDPATYAMFAALTDNVVADMDAAKDEAAAKGLVPFFWEVASWSQTIASHVFSSGKRLPAEFRKDDKKTHEAANDKTYSPRVRALIHKHEDDEACTRQVKMAKPVRYPPDALYKGFVGTVMLQGDVDAEGKFQNPMILASVPAKPFGQAALKSVKDIRFEGKPGFWNDSCEMAHKDHIVEFQFVIAR
jgi:TonB family protein